MTTKISNVTDLDFDTIKSNLMTHYKKSNSPFKDWDFNGSGLNYLLDVLAYNTHYNAVNAHVSMNETFIDSAQVRSNVVSRAKLLGYIPSSNSGSSAIVTAEFIRADGNTNVTELTMPRGTKFTTNVNGKTYIFTTLEEYTTAWIEESNSFVFDNVVINEGKLINSDFIVNSAVINQRYKIEDSNIDINTLRVKVYEHSNAVEYDTYVESANFTVYEPDSKVYFLSEDYDGFYQIEFGDGVIGTRLENLQRIEVEYMSTMDNPANGNSLSDFAYGSVPGDEFSAISDNESVTIVEVSSGGQKRETTESIRLNAPLTFIAQNRAVTVVDYESLLKKNISGLDAISVWGGQDHNPPQYGKVFLSIKPSNSLFLTDSQKTEIETYLETIKLMTVKPEILDPTYLYIYFDSIFQYNSALTNLTKSELQSKVRADLQEYSDTVLGAFEKTFRYSNFLSIIDDADEAIINSYVRLKCYKVVNIISNSNQPIKVEFNLQLLGDPDQTESFISSTSWEFNGQDLYLKDEPMVNSDDRRVYAYTLLNSGTNVVESKVFTDIGRIDVKSGVIELDNLPTTFDTSIQVSITPNSYDIATVREQLLTFDFARSNIVGKKDEGNTNFIPTPLFRN